MLRLFPSAYPFISSSEELEFQSAGSCMQKHPVDSGTKSPAAKTTPTPEFQVPDGWLWIAFMSLSFSCLLTLTVLLGTPSPPRPHFYRLYGNKSLYNEMTSLVARGCTYLQTRTCVGFVWTVYGVYSLLTDNQDVSLPSATQVCTHYPPLWSLTC